MNKLISSAATAALIFAVAGAATAAPKKAAAPAASGPVATQPVAVRGAAPVASPAAARPAAPALPPLTQGPTVPGICVYSGNEVMGTSQVGRAMAARMQQLRAQAAAELQGEQAAIDTEASALEAKKATLTADQFNAQAAPIRARAEALNNKAAQRQRELEATGQDALVQIGQRLNPILRTLYQQHSCSILFGDGAVMVVKPEMDFTGQAVQQLNAVMQTITFDRKVLPAQPAGQ